MTKTKAKKRARLSNEPQDVHDELWYYEERKGLCVVDPRTHNVYVAIPRHLSDFPVLPWSMVEASVKRWQAVQREKRKAKK